jgi:hypothetical protein
MLCAQQQAWESIKPTKPPLPESEECTGMVSKLLKGMELGTGTTEP